MSMHSRPGAADDEVQLQYIPPKVDLKDLEPGKDGLLYLLTDKEREDVKKALKDEKPGARYKGKKHGFRYDVIKTADANGAPQYFILYKGESKGRALGSGAFGTVKVAQNLETGEFAAAKIISQGYVEYDAFNLPVRPQEVAAIEKTRKKETRPLAQLNELRGEATAESEKKGHQAIVIMDMAHGQDLRSIQKTFSAIGRNKPAVEWMQLCENIFREVHDLHQKKIIHRDLKVQNIMLDPASGKVTIIDKGLAISSDAAMPRNPGTGTPRTSAPEVHSGMYTFKTDVFACGATLGDFLRLGTFNHRNQQFEMYSDSVLEKMTDHPLRNTELRKQVAAFLRRCVDTDPDKRPSTEEAFRYFQNLQNDMLLLRTRTVSVGILNVDEFLTSELHIKKNMLAALKQFDKVVLVDTVSDRSQKEYASLTKLLAENGILAESRVITGSTERAAVNKVPAKLKSRNPDTHYECFHVSPQPSTKELYENGIKPLKAGHSKTEEYRNEIYNRRIDDVTVDSIMNSLRGEVKRMTEKYGKHGEIANPIARDRIKAITGLLDKLNANRAAGIMYADIRRDLLAVQDKTLSTSRLGKTFSFLAHANVTGAKEIAKITTRLEDVYGDNRPKAKRKP